MSDQRVIRLEINPIALVARNIQGLLQVQGQQPMQGFSRSYTPARSLARTFADSLMDVGQKVDSALTQFQANLTTLSPVQRQSLATSVTHLVRMEETLSALQRTPALGCLREVARQHLDLAGTQTLVRDQLQALSSGRIHDFDRLAPRAASQMQQLTQGLQSAHQKIRQAEEQYTLDSLQGAMQDLGYEVSVQRQESKSREPRVVVRARKSGNAFLAVLERSRLRLDAMSADGRSCKTETDRLCQELTKRGLDAAVVEAHFFGKRHAELQDRVPASGSSDFNPLAAPQKARRLHQNRIRQQVHAQQRTRTN
jgi:hypothetical protein